MPSQAQAPPPGAGRPVFEVASIKRNVSVSNQASVRAQPGGRLTVTNNSLRNMAEAFGLFDPLFDFPHAAEKLVELAAVGRAQLAVERLRVVADEIQDRALLVLTPLEVLLALARRAGPEQPLEHQPRVRLGRDRRRRGTPGEVVLVGA